MGSGNDNDRYIQQRPDKRWEVVKQGHKRASTLADTQREAIDRGRQVVHNAGGGELVIKGRDGRIRDKDTVNPGSDSPRRDTR